VDLADAAFDEFLGFGVEDGAHALAADLENAPGLFLRFDDHVTIGYFADHRLLTVDILAGLEGVCGNAGVPVIGGGDDDGVDIAAGEQFAIVAGGEDVLAIAFLSEGAAAIVNVGNSDDFDARQGRFGLHIFLAHDAEADAAYLHAVVGRNRLRRFLQDASGFTRPSVAAAMAVLWRKWRRLVGMIGCVLLSDVPLYPGERAAITIVKQACSRANPIMRAAGASSDACI
jgi:hypothetical protein